MGTLSNFNVDELTGKMTATVYQEKARTSKTMTSRFDKVVNNTSTVNNDKGIRLIIESFNNNREQNVENLATEFEFY